MATTREILRRIQPWLTYYATRCASCGAELLAEDVATDRCPACGERVDRLAARPETTMPEPRYIYTIVGCLPGQDYGELYAGPFDSLGKAKQRLAFYQSRYPQGVFMVIQERRER